MSETANRKKKAPFAGLSGQVERLACDGLTSTALARRLAVRITELGETDQHFLSEAQDAAGVIAGLIEHDEPARAAWLLLGDEIEGYRDRTAPGRDAEAEETIDRAMVAVAAASDGEVRNVLDWLVRTGSAEMAGEVAGFLAGVTEHEDAAS